MSGEADPRGADGTPAPASQPIRRTVTITLNLHPGQAAGLKRFANKVAHSDALAVLYPHVPPELRSEQAYQILQAFEVVRRALDEAYVSDWPWMETGRP